EMEPPTYRARSCKQCRLQRKPSSMRTRGVPLVDAGTRPRQFVAARPGVSSNVKTGIVIGPVDQAILEYRVRSCNTLRNRHGITHFARRLRNDDLDRAPAESIP